MDLYIKIRNIFLEIKVKILTRYDSAKTKKGNKLVQSCNKIKSDEASFLVTISCLAYAEAQ